VETGGIILAGGDKFIHIIYHADTLLGLLDSEDEGTTILQNISNYSHNKTM
jgi:hypothetical protein